MSTITLGYLAIARTEDDFARATESRRFTKQTAQLAPLMLRSVVTDSNVVLETGISFGGEDKAVSVVRVPVKTVTRDAIQAAQKIEDTDGIKFELEPVPVLAIVQDGGMKLLDLGTDGLQKELPRDAVMVGAISSPGVYRLSCFDSTTDTDYDLGYLVAGTEPAPEFVSRKNQSGYEEFEDFVSWITVAKLRREQFKAAQMVEERAAREDAIEFLPSGEMPYHTKEQAKRDAARLEALKVPEPVPDIVIEFRDAELFQRALTLGPLNYTTKQGGWHIAQTKEALAALQQARAELKAESESVEEPVSPEVQQILKEIDELEAQEEKR